MHAVIFFCMTIHTTFPFCFTDSGEDGRNSKIAEGINSYRREGEDITGELK